MFQSNAKSTQRARQCASATGDRGNQAVSRLWCTMQQVTTEVSARRETSFVDPRQSSKMQFAQQVRCLGCVPAAAAAGTTNANANAAATATS